MELLLIHSSDDIQSIPVPVFLITDISRSQTPDVLFCWRERTSVQVNTERNKTTATYIFKENSIEVSQILNKDDGHRVWLKVSLTNVVRKCSASKEIISKLGFFPLSVSQRVDAILEVLWVDSLLFRSRAIASHSHTWHLQAATWAWLFITAMQVLVYGCVGVLLSPCYLLSAFLSAHVCAT